MDIINIKKITLTVLILGFAFMGFSQSIKEKQGEKYYALYDYYSAIKKYEPLANKSKEIKSELAVSYFRTGQYDKSEQYYQELVAEDKNPDVIYDYVKVLLINQKYDEAEKWMKEFQKLAPNDNRAVLFASNQGFYQELSKNQNYFAVKKLDFNSDVQEFATSFYKDKIVFSSTKKENELFKRRWSWNHLPYLDLYVADYDSASMELKNIEKFKFNKKYHEGTAAFNKSGDFMIVTTNNYKDKSSDREVLLGMFYSNFNDGSWESLKPMPFNNKDYSVGHPSLTADGNTLYFSSDMPGGIGGVDIYVSTKNSDGTWSESKNLGVEVNTPGNEMFPFIHQDGYLFYSSDGRPGLGGLDVFVTKIVDGKPSEIQNLKAPINSNFDDFAFILTEDMKRGYFSSDRISGKGYDDIYGFDMINPFFATKLVTGITVNKKDGSIISGVEVTLYDNENKVIEKLTTADNGVYNFNIEQDKLYVLVGEKDKYTVATQPVDASIPDPVIKTNLLLEKFPDFKLHFLVLDNDTKKPIPGAIAKYINKDDKNDVISFTADNNGEYFKDLTEVKLNTVLKYDMSISKDKYVAVAKDASIALSHEGQIDVIEELTKLKVGVDLGVVLNLNPIYYDFNKFDIRPDAALELDKIVKAMNENPTLSLELGSHSDSRGSAKYNASLSSKRANSAVKYIQERIKDPKRIYGKGYGESTPLKITKDFNVKHQEVPVGITLNDNYINKLPSKKEQEDAHQLNRRTEFKIIKF
ncbi:MAG: OmpA family protein [Bacteroidales bacterium]|nr:OmpA family protein [Bacteroidales bacterium]